LIHQNLKLYLKAALKVPEIKRGQAFFPVILNTVYFIFSVHILILLPVRGLR
jgi:hypothetical protein